MKTKSRKMVTFENEYKITVHHLWWSREMVGIS